ncbi:MAG: hypothetical protein SGJ18_07270 [Pseudomonadota bacterium]|nr:hypothetical protein [Pseudomonadota bacterium]
MKVIKVLFTLGFLVSLGCAKDGIPILGLDGDGKVSEFFIGEKDFKENMTGLIDSVNKSTIKVLEEKEAKPFMLRTVVVGVGLKFEAGFGPFAKASAEPKVRFVFSNVAKDVPMP